MAVKGFGLQTPSRWRLECLGRTVRYTESSISAGAQDRYRTEAGNIIHVTEELGFQSAGWSGKSRQMLVEADSRSPGHLDEEILGTAPLNQGPTCHDAR